MGDQEGFRLKSIRLRGVVSQGLLLPTSALTTTDYAYNDMPCVGDDVTDLLGVVKYEPPIPAELSGVAKGQFPPFLRKTDEERIQNLSNEYEDMRKERYYVTEKIDGTSATFYYNDGVFGVCSRNLELVESESNTYWKIAHQYDLPNRMTIMDKNIAIQGEIYGEGIQANKYKIKGQKLAVFNVFDIDKQEKMSVYDMTKLCMMFSLTPVPIIDGDFTLPNTIEELLQYAEGKSKLHPETEREGVVIRSHDCKVSFKAISNKFLLKQKD
jgi:RNA ligase (TIGR02306 family)